MSSKVAGILNRVLQDRRHGDYDKALKRLAEGIEKFPGDVSLHREAIDLALEAGESMRAVQLLKSAFRQVPDTYEELRAFGTEKVETFNDPILCKYLLDVAIKKRDFEAAGEVLEGLKDHTAGELLKRTRNKKQSLSTAGNHGFKGEITVNTLAEAMLCVRSKRFQDAARTFVQILDDKPVEHKVLTPYLSTLQKKYPKKGGISYALGCGYLLSEKYEIGIAMVVQGAALAPTNADDAVKRIDALRGKHDAPDDLVELALAKLLIIKGDDHDATDRLNRLLEDDQAKAGSIIELLEPHVEEVGENLVLNYLYIETALLAGSNARALVQIKNIYQEARHRNDLLAWLDMKTQERFMTVEILARYGEMALEQQMFEKAIEIFRELLSQAPHEVHYVKELVGGYVKDANIKEFFDELAGTQPVAKQHDDDFSIEHYGSRDFSLDGHSEQASAEPSRPKKSESKKQAPTEPAQDEQDDTIEARRPTEPAQDEQDDTIEAKRPTEPTPDEQNDGFLDLPGADGHASVVPEEPVSHEDRTETPLEREGADSDSGTEETTGDSESPQTPDVILLGVSDLPEEEVRDVAESAKGQPGATMDVEEADDFASRYEGFENGDLDNNEIIELVEKAARMGKVDEMKKLLSFKPENLAQEVKRKYYLSEYYLHEDQPLSALVILKTVNLNGLSKEERKAFLLKNAYCYQQLNRFDAAHSAYLKIMSEDPNFSAAEHMAKVNYEKHLQSSASGGPVLEKVSTLHKTDKKEEER
jgi:tetratricopeptide (TPR) repeat protein